MLILAVVPPDEAVCGEVDDPVAHEDNQLPDLRRVLGEHQIIDEGKEFISRAEVIGFGFAHHHEVV